MRGMGRRPILFIPTFSFSFSHILRGFAYNGVRRAERGFRRAVTALGNRIGREGAALIVLTLALCAVFALSVRMYDTLEAETADGALAAAADAARGFLSENEAVAAFLGFSADAEVTDTEDADADVDTAVDEAAVRAAAADYIARYNKIYAELR